MCTRPTILLELMLEAREDFWLPYKGMRDRIGAERGWPPMSKAEFEQEIQHGSLYLGSPETVAQKIAATVRALGIARFDLKYSAGNTLARQADSSDRALRHASDSACPRTAFRGLNDYRRPIEKFAV